MKKNNILKILISFAMLIFLVYVAGLQSILETLFTLDPIFILLALFMTLPSMTFRFLRWKYVLNASHVRISFPNVTRIFLIGFFFGTITPSKIGNLIKFHYLKKYHKIRTSKALSLSIADRIFDLIIIILISLVGIISILGKFSNIYIVFIALFVVVVLLFIIFNERSFKTLSRFFIRRSGLVKKILKRKKEINVDKTTNSLYEPFREIKKPKNFLPIFLVSILVWISAGIQLTFILEAMDYSVGFYYSIIFICIGTLVSLVPITASGFGVREGVFAVLFTIINLPLNAGVLASLIAFLVGQIPPALIGLGLYITYREKQHAA